MISIKEVKNATYTEEKRIHDKLILVSNYIWRPLSFGIAALLVSLDISANTVTLISLLPALLFIPVLSFGHSVPVRVAGCCIIFIWSLLDYTDGTIARYKGQSSSQGDFMDAVSGYIVMCGIPLASGMAAYLDHVEALIRMDMDPVVYAFLGGLGAICQLLPRLAMHKKNQNRKGNEFQNLSGFSRVKALGYFLIDPSGIVVILLLISCAAHLLNVYVLVYSVIYLVFCATSLTKLLIHEE